MARDAANRERAAADEATRAKEEALEELTIAAEQRHNALLASARVTVQEGIRLRENDPPQQGEALAFFAHALRTAAKSLAANSWLSDSLVNTTWFIPVLNLHHKDRLNSAGFSPNGQRVLTASDDSTARVWDANSGKPIGGPLQHGAKVNSASFSPDGARIITASEDGTAQVWDATSEKPLSAPLQHSANVTSASFSPDGALIVTASADGIVRLWDAGTGKQIGSPIEPGSHTHFAAFSPDGRRLITASWAAAEVWDTATKRLVSAASTESAVKTATFSPDGRRFLTTYAAPRQAPGLQFIDTRPRLWDSATGTLVTTFGSGGGESLAVFSADGRLVVTGAGNGTARIWETDTGKPVSDLLRHGGILTSAAFSPNGKSIVTASSDGTVRAWETRSGKPLCAPLQHPRTVVSARFSPDGQRLLTASDDGIARVWDLLTDGPVRLQLSGLPSSEIGLVNFSPNGRRLIFGFWNGSAGVVETDTGKLVSWARPHATLITSATFSPDGRRVVTASLDHTAQVWEADTGKLVAAPLRHNDRVLSAEFSPDERLVVTAAADYTVRIWEVNTSKLVRTLKPESFVVCASFVRGGRRIVSVSGDGMVQFWDANTGERVGRIQHAVEGAYRAFSAPLLRLAIGGSDDATSVRIWDAASGKVLGAPLPHKDRVVGVMFSSDGRRVLTNAWDPKVQIWESDTGMPLGEPLHNNELLAMTPPVLDKAAAFSPDGRRVVTASDNGTARIWTVLLDCCGNQQEANRLAQLAEIVSGLHVTDTGSVEPLPGDRRQLMADLYRTVRNPDAPTGTVDWIITRFARQFLLIK